MYEILFSKVNIVVISVRSELTVCISHKLDLLIVTSYVICLLVKLTKTLPTLCRILLLFL